MTYTHEGQDFDVIIDLGNIILQGLERDLVIQQGGEDLEAECIRACSHEFTEHDGSKSIDYDRDNVTSLMDERMPHFIARNIFRAVVTEHNLN